MNREHIGGSFEDFLREDGIFEEVNSAALKRVIALQIAQEMKKQKISKRVLAERMQTSRAALDRLLDEDNSSVTLKTLDKVASVLGKRLVVEFA